MKTKKKKPAAPRRRRPAVKKKRRFHPTLRQVLEAQIEVLTNRVKHYEKQIAEEDLTRDAAHRVYLERYRTASPELRQILDSNWEKFTRQAFLRRWKPAQEDGISCGSRLGIQFKETRI